MSNFAIGASPAFSNFWNLSTSYGSQLAFSTVISRVWPYTDSQGYDISAMSSYRNQSFFRYLVNVNSTGRGTVRIIYPFDSGAASQHQSPWFRVGNPPYITVLASPIYPYSFNSWRTDAYNTTFLSSNNPASIGWNATGNINVTAIFN